MTQGHGEFQFKTKPAPQMTGVDGALWEHVPLASFPPSFDITFPSSFTNALSVSLSNIASTFSGFSNTLTGLTQNLQNAACSFNGLIDGLVKAQKMAQDFADANNSSQIYVRPIGLQPAGTITSVDSFLAQVRRALNDTGKGVGQIPRITPAQIPLDPAAIASALGGTSSAEQLLDNLGLSGSSSFGVLNVNLGLGLPELSNQDQIKDGFESEDYSTGIAAIIKESVDSPELRVSLRSRPPGNPNDLVGRTVQLAGSVSSANIGTFTITGVSDGGATFQGNEGSLLDVSGFNQIQQGISTVQSALSLFALKINNSSGVPQNSAQGTATIDLGGVTIPTRDLIRSALEKRGLLAANEQRFLPVTDLVDILIEEEIIGVNPDVFDKDKATAIERIARLVGPTNIKVGGILLVGQAPNLPTLAAKVGAISEILEFLQPAAAQLFETAKQANLNNPSGINYNQEEVELEQLNSTQNVGVLDAQAAAQVAADSKVLDFTMPELVSYAESVPQPPPDDFNAWRCFSLVDLIPPLGVYNSFEQATKSKVGSAIANGFGTLAGFIEDGQSAVSDGLNNLQSKTKQIDSVVDQMNDLNKKMVDGLNFLKSQIEKNPFKVDGHLIGPRLDLLSNAQYVDSVESALRDVTDPNRPTFGPPPVTSAVDNQAQIIAQQLGVAGTTQQTKLWFGILIFIVGDGRKDLGDQMRSVAELLGMNADKIDLPAKKKLSLTF